MVQLLLLPVVGNGLDQVTVGGAHANPQGGDGIGKTTAGAVAEDESRDSFTDEEVVGDRTSAEGRTHGSVHVGGGDSSKSCENLGAGVHIDGAVCGRCVGMRESEWCCSSGRRTERTSYLYICFTQ
jgi:hypothetical protein